MLPKFRGASPSTSVAVRFPSLVEELRRSKEQGEKRSASTLRGNCIDVLLSFEINRSLVFPYECLYFMHECSDLIYFIIDQVRSKLDLGF
jgi:hypothetical protein